METILLTGGTGLIGTSLTDYLIENGNKVRILSRRDKISKNDRIRYFSWKPSEFYIPHEALEGVDHVVNMAGANIFAKGWTKEYKDIIYRSRINSTKTIIQAIEKNDDIKTLISMSATGYYPSGNEVFTEKSIPGNGYLSKVCLDWENEALKLKDSKKRLVILRTGNIISREGGMIEKVEIPVKLGIGAYLGSGKQKVSWIHLKDFCKLIVFILKNKAMEGIYNAVSPNPVSNKELTKAMAHSLHKPLFLPNVPAFALRLFLGDRANLALKSFSVSSSKLETSGFQFDFPTIVEAMRDLYTN